MWSMLHEKRVYANCTPEKIVRLDRSGGATVRGWRGGRETFILTMEKSRLDIKVGLFIFIGLALLAVLMLMFSKSTSLFRGTYELHLHAVNVGGIKPRAGVLLAGDAWSPGSVENIRFEEGGKSVTIDLKIYKDSPPVYHDARFVIEQAGFLGDQFISIIPMTNAEPILADGAQVDCQSPFNIQQVGRARRGGFHPAH